LLTWLAPAREYLVGRGIPVPPPGDVGEIDYDKLAGAFMDPEPDMPGYLAESLHIVGEMADKEGMDAILEAAERRGIKLHVADDCTPGDVALEAWLKARELLEALHVEQQFERPRSFVCFGCAEETVPAFEAPTRPLLDALQARLDDWFAGKKRGRGCRVMAFPNGSECRFLVRHGEPCKREGAIKDGEATTVFYRPAKYAVLRYHMERGEIQIHCSGKRELEELRKAFGSHLFGKEEFFPATGKYLLAPLVGGRECLACGDIAGIESVKLTLVEIFERGTPWQRITRESEDVFALAEQGAFRWPSPDRITRAGFEVKFTSGNKPRRVTIMPPNRALYGRDDDSLLIEEWLRARGFIVEVPTAEN
jgi:hypothetical protein